MHFYDFVIICPVQERNRFMFSENKFCTIKEIHFIQNNQSVTKGQRGKKQVKIHYVCLCMYPSIYLDTCLYIPNLLCTLTYIKAKSATLHNSSNCDICAVFNFCCLLFIMNGSWFMFKLVRMC